METSEPSVNRDPLAPVIERAKRLEPDAFDLLVDRYSSRLYGFLLRLTSSPEDAEDIVQEVFLRLVRTIGEYEHAGHFEAWLFRIATNLARDRIRRIVRGPKTTSLGPSPDANDDVAASECDPGVGSPPKPGAAMELADEVDRLQGALAKLPEAERVVVLLRHYTALSFAEIAEAMETPLGTALARAHRGLAKLRAMMESAR